MKNKTLPSGICSKHAIGLTLYTHGFISPSFLFCSVKTLKLYLAPFKSHEREDKSREGAYIFLLENPHMPVHKQRAVQSHTVRSRLETSSSTWGTSPACAVGIFSTAWRSQASKYWGTEPQGQWQLAMGQCQGRISRELGQEKKSTMSQAHRTAPQKGVR